MQQRHSSSAIRTRIIGIPEDLERTELRDDTSGFIAFVPVGSLARVPETRWHPCRRRSQD